MAPGQLAGVPKWHAQVIASDTVDTEPCLSVFFESTPSAKYLFGCGESTTRACIQRKYGIKKVKAIFATGVSTERTTGLPGLLMTLADMGSKHVDLLGPQGLAHYVASTRSYCQRGAMSISVKECPATTLSNDAASPVFEDENIAVFATSILPDTRTPPQVSQPPSPSSLQKRKRASSYSPEPPSRRAVSPVVSFHTASAHAVELASQDPEPKPWHHPRFSPSRLHGSEAQTWRTLTIESMFSRGRDAFFQSLESPPKRVYPGRLKKRLPRAEQAVSAVSYLVVGPATRGKFDAATATKLGIVKGPDRGRLTRGESVTLADGRVVTPDMCIGPSVPPSAFLFVDCPSPSYISNMMASPMFDFSSRPTPTRLHLIVHRVGEGVIEDKRYKQWMATFGPSVHHLVASPRYSPNTAAFTSSAFTQLRFSQLDSDIFRVPSYSSTPAATLSDVTGLPANVQLLKAGHSVNMTPPTPPAIPSSNYVDTFHGVADAGAELTPELARAFAQVRDDVRATMATRNPRPKPGDDIIITALGTGSSMPSKYRNVSSTIVHIPGRGNIIFDCGEGTWGQMCRHFGTTRSPGPHGSDVVSVLRDTRCIFISHIHGDHQMGLARILAKRRTLDPPPDTPLYLIANRATHLYLQEYQDLQDLGFDNSMSGVRRIIADEIEWRKSGIDETWSDHESSGSWNGERGERTSALEGLKNALGLTSVATVDVIHRAYKCFGIVIKHKDNWSIVFSGDTEPCENLVEAGKGATLLIHEATMADDQAEMAAQKTHSTFAQAIDIGTRMNARNILLTHFSQRYPKVAVVSAAPADSTTFSGPRPTIATAFDYASLRIGDLWKMEKYMPAIVQCYDDADEDEAGETP